MCVLFAAGQHLVPKLRGWMDNQRLFILRDWNSGPSQLSGRHMPVPVEWGTRSGLSPRRGGSASSHPTQLPTPSDTRPLGRQTPRQKLTCGRDSGRSAVHTLTASGTQT